MPDNTESYLEGQITILETAIALLAKALLPPEEYREFQAQLRELVLGAAEKTSLLRASGTLPDDLTEDFLLGLGERTKRLLNTLAALRAGES